MDATSISELRKIIEFELSFLGIEQSELRAETETILAYVSKMSLAERLRDPEKLVAIEAVEQARAILERRKQHEPLQYCLGETSFYGLQIFVRPGVLIPRQDTETLVEQAIAYLNSLSGSKDICVGEIGCGSGAVFIALLKSIPNLKVLACDISDLAIEVSRQNAEFHGVSNRVSLSLDDWKSWIRSSGESMSLILSNPPYIPLKDKASLQAEIRDYEPESALFGAGEDGLGFYREFAELAPSYLNGGCRALLEVGFAQSKSVIDIFCSSKWHSAGAYSDLGGIERVVAIVSPGAPFGDS